MRLMVIRPVSLQGAVRLADSCLRSKVDVWPSVRSYIVDYYVCTRALLNFYRTGRLPPGGMKELLRLVMNIEVNPGTVTDVVGVTLPSIVHLIEYID